MTGVDQRTPEAKTLAAPSRWYVRSTTARKNGRPTGWHVEGPDVDHMLCGEAIDLNDGEVRARPPTRNLCEPCGQKLRENVVVVKSNSRWSR